MSARGLRLSHVTVKPIRSGLAGMVAREVVELGRDIESLRGRILAV